jgi:hypothetical protein
MAIGWPKPVSALERQHPPGILRGKSADLIQLPKFIAWMLIFFFASAAASSAYLTASEIFPLEAPSSDVIEAAITATLSFTNSSPY